MTAIWASDPGKTVIRDTALEKFIDREVNDRPPEPVGGFIASSIFLFELYVRAGLEPAPTKAIERRFLRLAGMVLGSGAF
ncbi:MAG: hypothetical protein ABIH23_16545 [bacterium]